MATRVDFKHVRENASFEAVLAAYGIELQKDGQKPGQYKALCPFHDDTKPSLKVNTERNIFHCFACDAKGNVLEFVRDMDGLAEGEIRAAAMKVASICNFAPAPGGEPNRRKAKVDKSKEDTPPPPSPKSAKTPVDETLDGDRYNRVLTFQLQLTQDDALKAWLESRGIDHHAQKTFGLGRASKRSKTIADRLAIPIHNPEGGLVAYCGRYASDDVPKDVPKYVLPKGFRKDLEVFNLHRAVDQLDARRTMLVFESYFSAMRFHRHAPCVSFMGRSVSERQLEVMAALRTAQRVYVIADGDEPGRTGARAIAGALAPHFWARVVDLPDDAKPHRMEWDELYERVKANW